MEDISLLVYYCIS